MSAQDILQLTLTATKDNSKGLTLKSANSDRENGVKSDVKICDGCIVNSKINLLDISVLNLSYCNLKNLPNGFSALENLRVLNLSNNNLTVLPECLQKHLKFIEYLDLSSNLLSEFETEPACYKRLRVLLLNSNQLLNIPEWLLYVRCFNLEEFDYSFNEVNRLYASQFHVSSNYRLKKILLQDCFVFERDFKYINTIKTLQYLDLSNHPCKAKTNTIIGERLFQKPAFSNTLQILKLNYLNLSILSENISCLVHLRELHLKRNNLSWLPVTIISLNDLEVLDVSENVISYLPEGLYKMLSLRQLIAHSNCITLLFDLSQMPQLRYLDLYENMLNDFPSDISMLSHVDFEKNLFKTQQIGGQYQGYIEKRQNLRTAAALTHRVNTSIPPADLESSFEDDAASSSSVYSDSEEHLKQVTGECIEEMWDAPYESNYVRVCTASDDEWLGLEPPMIALRKRNSRDMHQPNASPVFDDAEE